MPGGEVVRGSGYQPPPGAAFLAIPRGLSFADCPRYRGTIQEQACSFLARAGNPMNARRLARSNG